MKEHLNEIVRFRKLAGLLIENTKYADLKALEDILIKNGYKFVSDDDSFDRATYKKDDKEISLFDKYDENKPKILFNVPGQSHEFAGKGEKRLVNYDIIFSDIQSAIPDLQAISAL